MTIELEVLDTAKCVQRRCIDCGAWLSLGPSNDDDERVAIEVRAAEIVASGKPRDTCSRVDLENDCEECGWNDYVVCAHWCPDGKRDGWDSGWLARHIVEETIAGHTDGDDA